MNWCSESDCADRVVQNNIIIDIHNKLLLALLVVTRSFGTPVVYCVCFLSSPTKAKAEAKTKAKAEAKTKAHFVSYRLTL